MSVIVLLRLKADVEQFERYAAENGEKFERIAEDGKSRGALHHLFAAGDGEILVVDEWPDAQSFQDFFGSQTEIPELMAGAGAQGEPEISVFRTLDTPDRF